MNNKSFTFLTILFLLCTSLLTYGQDSTLPERLQILLPNLNQEDLTKLIEKKELVKYFEDVQPKFEFMPRNNLEKTVRKQFEGYEPNVCDEVLFLLPKPETNQDMTVYLYNVLRNIKTLSGIQYMSNHYREERTLFEDVYQVESMTRKRAVKSTYLMKIPESENFPIHLKDVNFGNSYYLATYAVKDGQIGFGLENLSSLKYYMPIIGPEQVRFQILIIPMENEILMYGICGVNASDFVRNMIHIPSSFLTRIRALNRWFKEQAY